MANSLDIQIQPEPAPQRNVFIRSDQYNFIRHGVPAVKIDFGFEPNSADLKKHDEWLKNRYHAPSDDLGQPIDKKAAGEYDRLIMALAETVANAPGRPQWKADSFFRRFAQ